MSNLLPYLFFAFVAVLAVAFCFGIFHAFRLFSQLGGKDAVSASTLGALRNVKLSAAAIAVLMVSGILGLMILARGKGEDIAGIVAPCIVVATLASTAAIVAGLVEKRTAKAHCRT